MIRAEVNRLFYVEHFTRNAIAHALGIHHDTVKALLERPKVISPGSPPSTMLAPYLWLIEETLQRYPKIRSTRILQLLKDRGYRGSITILRSAVRQMRPVAQRAFMPVTILAGEQGQVDWAHFGKLAVENTERKLSCFVMVLSYSRSMFACFTLDQSMESFLRSHVKAFRYLGGVPRKLLYDNLKNVVLSRTGSEIEFNPHHLEFSGHYLFKPMACNVRSGWEKGRVERSIRYIRDNFFAARTFKDLADANSQLTRWLDETANKRAWPEDRAYQVDQKWEEEKTSLLALPQHEPPTAIMHAVKSGKWPFVRFDLNDYSIPYRYVGKTLTLIAEEGVVRILDGVLQLARHLRSYGKGKKLRVEEHFTGLLEKKPHAEGQTKQQALIALIPEAQDLIVGGEELGLSRLAELRKISSLIAEYGEAAIRDAIIEALRRDKPRATVVAQIAYETMNRNVESFLLPLDLPSRQNLNQLSVIPHDLARYDELGKTERRDHDEI